MTAVLLGLDPSLLRVGWAAVDIDTHQPVAWGCCDVDASDGDWRHIQFRVGLQHVRNTLDSIDIEVVFTVREEPISRFPRAAKQHGQSIGYLEAALRTTWPYVPPPVPLEPAAWKKDTVGHGNASKDEVRAWAEHIVGEGITSQDAADAIGVAVAGCMRVAGEDAA